MKYRFKRRPYRHQVEALKKLLSTGFGGALLMQARTGKTKVAIDYACILHMAGKVNRVMVFMPAGPVMEVWIEQIEENVPDDISYRITLWDKEGREKEPLPKWGEDVLDFVLVNYDAFKTPAKMKGRDKKTGEIKRYRRKGGRYDVIKKIKKWQPQLGILDESHRIKTPSAKQTTGIIQLAHNMKTGDVRIPYRVIMSGTPRTKKRRPFDLYSQWKYLNPGRFYGMSLSDFKHEFGRFVELNGYEKYLRPRNEEKLLKMIKKDSFITSRAECYDLPPRLPDRIIHIDLEPETARVYDEMTEELIARIHTGEISEASISLVQTIRLTQFTSGIAKLTNPDGTPGKLIRISSEKLDALRELLIDLAEQDEKVLIAAKWRADLASIAQLGQKLKIPTFEVHGGVKRDDRWKQIGDFKKVEGCGILVAQPAAASLGIDLREAGTTIWYSLTGSWVDWDQFNDRNALNERGVQPIYLLARDTVDEIAYQGLMEDDDIGKMIYEKPELLRRQ